MAWRLTWRAPSGSHMPFLGRVLRWPAGDPPELLHGRRSGDRTVKLVAQADDLLRRVWRTRSKQTQRQYCVVEDDGGLRVVSDDEARAHWESGAPMLDRREWEPRLRSNR